MLAMHCLLTERDGPEYFRAVTCTGLRPRGEIDHVGR
jgi:hypothetical protein